MNYEAVQSPLRESFSILILSVTRGEKNKQNPRKNQWQPYWLIKNLTTLPGQSPCPSWPVTYVLIVDWKTSVGCFSFFSFLIESFYCLYAILLLTLNTFFITISYSYHLTISSQALSLSIQIELRELPRDP